MQPSPVTNALVSSVHIFGVVLAFSSIWLRARALSRVRDDDSAVAGVLRADNIWGLSALVVIGSGRLRLLWLEKGWEVYSASPFFYAKMSVFGLVFALEVWPMVTLIGVRTRQKKDGLVLDADAARRFARISFVQATMLTIALVLAPMMARGVMQMG